MRLFLQLHFITSVGEFQEELANFEKVFSKNELPDDMPEFAWSAVAEGDEAPLINIMAATSLFPSKKEIRRLIEQGAVKVNSERVSDPFLQLKRGGESVVQAGKRIFFRVKE